MPTLPRPIPRSPASNGTVQVRPLRLTVAESWLARRSILNDLRPASARHKDEASPWVCLNAQVSSPVPPTKMNQRRRTS
ncbi:hypothetical protein OH77DRAFT_976813 [Trametes cingulata]|nr:hypothetical protein OH77DRAFT_976813 [Trametes cingulata]